MPSPVPNLLAIAQLPKPAVPVPQVQLPPRHSFHDALRQAKRDAQKPAASQKPAAKKPEAKGTESKKTVAKKTSKPARSRATSGNHHHTKDDEVTPDSGDESSQQSAEESAERVIVDAEQEIASAKEVKADPKAAPADDASAIAASQQIAANPNAAPVANTVKAETSADDAKSEARPPVRAIDFTAKQDNAVPQAGGDTNAAANVAQQDPSAPGNDAAAPHAKSGDALTGKPDVKLAIQAKPQEAVPADATQKDSSSPALPTNTGDVSSDATAAGAVASSDADPAPKAAPRISSDTVNPDPLAATAQPATKSQTAPSQVAVPQAPPAPPEAQFAEANHARIVTGIRSELLPGGGSMHIRLDPPELGAMNVTVHLRDGVMTASFETSNDQATKLLSHSLSDLKSVLEAQGMNVEKLHVTQLPKGQSPSSQKQQPDRGSQDPAAGRDRQREQQRQDMLRRMWRRLSKGGDPLDLVA